MTIEEDIQYFRDKLCAALQVPRECLGPPSIDISDALARRDDQYVLEFYKTKVTGREKK